MKKTLFIIGGIIILLALIGIVMYFGGTSEAIVSIPDPNARGNYMDATSTFATSIGDVQVNGITAYLGQISSSSSKILCGNSNENSLSNSYSLSGDSLTLKSTLGSGTSCENYIKVNGTFPKGTIKATCKLKATEGKMGTSWSYCKINNVEKRVQTQEISNKVWTEGLFSGSFEYPTTENQNVDIEIREYTGYAGYGETEIVLTFVPLSQEVPIPTIPQPSGWGKFTAFLSLIIKNFLSLFTSQSIIGNSSVAPGSTQPYNVNLQATVPDSDQSDGTLQVQYANWILKDSSNNEISEGTWERVQGVYAKAITIVVPGASNKDFVIVGMITQINGTYNYNTGTWSWSEETPILHEEINVKTKYSVTSPDIPQPSGWAKFWSNIWVGIKSLFSWI